MSEVRDGRTRRRTPMVAALLGALLLTAGCTREQPQQPADLSARALTPVQALLQHVTPVWTAPIHPASRALVLPSVVLVHEAPAPGRLELVARSDADGHELWRTPVSQGTLADGGQLTVSTATLAQPDGDDVTVVAFLAAGGSNQLVLADPTTGQRRAEIPINGPGRLTTCPVVEGLCVERGETGHTTWLQLGPDGRRLDPLQLPIGRPEQVTSLGEGAYLVRKENRTRIGVLEGGQVHWEKPLADWLGAEVDPATHWIFARAKDDQLELSVRLKPWAGGETGFASAEITTAAVDLGDGSKLWQRTGVSWSCPGTVGLTCGGPGLRIARTTGSGGRPGGSPVVFGSPSATTGEPSWRREIANPQPAHLGSKDVEPTRLGTVLSNGDRLVLLDPESGEATTLEDDHWLACRSPQKFSAPRRGEPGAPVVDYAVSTSVTCSAGGLSMAEPAQFTLAAITSAGATLPDDATGEGPQPYAVVLPDQLAVYR